MTEFEVGGQTYRAAKLSAMAQFHVARRIAPIIPTLIPIFVKLSQGGGSARDLLGLADSLGPLTQALSDLSDDAAEYVIGNCLGVCQRRTPSGSWAPVWSGKAGCMFDDITAVEMLQIASSVIQDSLGPFIQGLLTSPQGSPSKD